MSSSDPRGDRDDGRKPSKILVVGASLAGLRTAEALRAAGSQARIVLAGSELHLPYDRPPLSKELLLGTFQSEQVLLRTPELLDELDVGLRLGITAKTLDVAARAVRFDDGSVEQADAVVIATGARPRSLPAAGGLENVFVLRTLDDALKIRATMAGASSMVVIGAGFIGSEVASAGRERGLAVTVVEASTAPLARVFGAELGARLGALHDRAGSVLLCGRTIRQFVGSPRVTAVQLDDGTVVPADLVVVGIGSTPNTEWLAGCGLEIGDGVHCDANGRAEGAEGIYAVGDVARWRDPRRRDAARTEHWTAAGEQAAIVAADILGTPPPTGLVPYVWSDQFGHRIQVAGHPAPAERIELLRDGEGSLAALIGADQRVTAAVVVDAPRLFAQLRRLVAQEATWFVAVQRARELV